MKSATGYIFYDEKRKRWIARLAPVDKDTGKQKEFKRYCLTQTDARKKLQELKNKFENQSTRNQCEDEPSPYHSNDSQSEGRTGAAERKWRWKPDLRWAKRGETIFHHRLPGGFQT